MTDDTSHRSHDARRMTFDEMAARAQYEWDRAEKAEAEARAMSDRATRAEQERDEAYERAACEALGQRCERGTPWDLACTTIAAAVRRLAAGPDKEK